MFQMHLKGIWILLFGVMFYKCQLGQVGSSVVHIFPLLTDLLSICSTNFERGLLKFLKSVDLFSYQFLLHILWISVIKCINIQEFYVLWINWWIDFNIIGWLSLLPCSILTNGRAIPTFFSLVLLWCISFLGMM